MNKSLIFISLLICISCLLSPIALFSTTSPITNVLNDQIAIDTLNKNRLKLLAITGGGTYAIGSAGLYWTWYKDYPSQKFHFFNDLAEWNQVDKAGHILLKNQPIAVCDKTAGALKNLGRDDIYLSESTFHYDGGGCC